MQYPRRKAYCEGVSMFAAQTSATFGRALLGLLELKGKGKKKGKKKDKKGKKKH
jgi:hypothetical protein